MYHSVNRHRKTGSDNCVADWALQLGGASNCDAIDSSVSVILG